MKTILLSTTAALLLIGTSALAQNTNVDLNSSNANASTSSTANSASNSSAANQGNNQNINFNSSVPANTTSNQNVRYSGGTSNYQGSSSWSGGDQTIRSAPTVYAPPVSGGNPCTLAVSGGASWLGAGFSAGGTFVDQDCADRQKIAMIWNAGFKGTAKELMCNDQKTYNAFKTAGEPCAIRPEWEPKPVAGQPVPMAPVAAPMPAPAPMVQSAPVQQKPVPRCDARRGIVDNCYSG